MTLVAFFSSAAESDQSRLMTGMSSSNVCNASMTTVCRDWSKGERLRTW